jgi:hypothetical protein
MRDYEIDTLLVDIEVLQNHLLEYFEVDIAFHGIQYFFKSHLLFHATHLVSILHHLVV